MGFSKKNSGCRKNQRMINEEYILAESLESSLVMSHNRNMELQAEKHLYNI